MSGGLFYDQEHLGSMLPDYMGFKNIPSVRIEAACASGSLALRQAYLDIRSGVHDIAVVGGVARDDRVLEGQHIVRIKLRGRAPRIAEPHA